MSAVAVCAVVIGVIAVILIAHDQYEDGLIGRIALAGVVLAAVIIGVAEFDRSAVYAAPDEILLLLASMAVFMLRHLYRFLRYTRTGLGAWLTRRAR